MTVDVSVVFALRGCRLSFVLEAALSQASVWLSVHLPPVVCRLWAWPSLQMRFCWCVLFSENSASLSPGGERSACTLSVWALRSTEPLALWELTKPLTQDSFGGQSYG